MTRASTIAATALAAAILLECGAAAAMAATAPVDRNATRMADATQARPAADADDDTSANCSKSRKRLWVEGEGWIVRRVTICR